MCSRDSNRCLFDDDPPTLFFLQSGFQSGFNRRSSDFCFLQSGFQSIFSRWSSDVCSFCDRDSSRFLIDGPPIFCSPDFYARVKIGSIYTVAKPGSG